MFSQTVFSTLPGNPPHDEVYIIFLKSENMDQTHRSIENGHALGQCPPQTINQHVLKHKHPSQCIYLRHLRNHLKFANATHV